MSGTARRITAHQANHLPYPGFFAKMHTVDQFVILDDVQFVKGEYHNRNRIRLNAAAHWLTVPVIHSGRQGQCIADVEIDNRRDWPGTHLRTLQQNYSGAPHFAAYFPPFAELYAQPWERLIDFNLALIRGLAAALEISTPCCLSSRLPISGTVTDRLIDICAATGATEFVHGKHARDYVDFDKMSAAGIANTTQSYTAVEYPQTGPGFVANLAVIDVVLNCGPEARDVVLAGNTLQGV